MGGPAVPEGSPSPLLRCVPSASRHAKQLWLAFGSDTLRMYALAVSVDSTGAANATKRDFLMSSSLVTWRCSVVMPARPAVVRARRLPARVRVHLALKRRIWRSNVATQAGWSSDLCGGGPSTRGASTPRRRANLGGETRRTAEYSVLSFQPTSPINSINSTHAHAKTG